MEQVRRSAAFVLSHAHSVSIHQPALSRLADELRQRGTQPVSWLDCPFHYTGPRKLDFIFAVDALNFCFWPNPGFEYDTLSSGLKTLLEADEHALSPSRLCEITEAEVASSIFHGRDICLLDERCRLLRELGAGVLQTYGNYEAMVQAAGGSAAKLVELITAALPGFRDHAVYQGRQVFFYKRAQILVGDIWGAFEGRGLGEFHDLAALTMFADYRVPQVLHHCGALQYSQALADKIARKEELPSGCAEEVEIRAATIHACEQLKELLGLNSTVETDWLLWQVGEEQRETLPPHHRTVSIYY